jgi:glycyl-tRNA synthetase
MEMQYFVAPEDDQKWFEYWMQVRMDYHKDLGIREEKLRFHQHGPDELAHYAKDAYDIEYEFPFGWREFEGIHNRTDFDLSRHKEATGANLTFYDDQAERRYVPYIIETSAGADRSALVCLVDGFREEEVRGEKRNVLALDPRLAPFKVAIFPLVNRDGMPEIAHKIEDDLRKTFKVFYDDKGAVGKRYRRQDEIGTPFCVTVDSQTIEDQTVTIRDRDTMEQERIGMDRLSEVVGEKVG